jgi:DNA-binding transcriptional MerR regulator
MLTMTDTVSSYEACEYAEITYRQLDHWTRMGIIEPSGIPASSTVDADGRRLIQRNRKKATPGSGYARQWNTDDLARLRTIAILRGLGIDLRAIRDKGINGVLDAILEAVDELTG